MEERIYFTDSRTRFLDHQFCAVGEFITDQVEEFMQWAKDCNIRPKDIWYADLFEINAREHVARLILEDDGTVTISPVSKEDAVNPFRRKYGPFRRILMFGIRMMESIVAVKGVLAKDELKDFLARALTEMCECEDASADSSDNA